MSYWFRWFFTTQIDRGADTPHGLNFFGVMAKLHDMASFGAYVIVKMPLITKIIEGQPGLYQSPARDPWESHLRM
jgi:hypothetical protein